MQRFTIPLRPQEKDVLTFDFSQDLPDGVLLSGPPQITVALGKGFDDSPASIINGTAQIDVTSTIIYVPVSGIGRTEGAEYEITCVCATNDPKEQVAATAVLPVAR